MHSKYCRVREAMFAKLKSYTSSSDMSGVTQSAGTADGQHNSGDSGRIENPVDPPIPTIADLKAARKLARCRRTKTANRLQRVKALIAEYEGPVDGVELEEDEEYAKLQEEEESLEPLLIEAQLAAANAERAVSDWLRDDLSQRLPSPSLSVGRESQAFVTPDAFGDSPGPAAHTDGRQARTNALVTETSPASPPPPAAVPPPMGVSSGVTSLGPQPSVRSRVSSSKDAIGKLVIPHLLDKYEVLSHINMFCLILSDNGYGQYDGERFVPAERETTIVVRLLETLDKCPEVHAFAESTARSSQYGWDQTIDILKKRFGSKISLRGEANRRLKALRFLGPSMAEGFNQEVVVIANLWLSVYGKEGAEVRHLVSRIMGKLPYEVRQLVVASVLDKLPESCVHRWDNHVQLHEHAKHFQESPSVCLTEIISVVCKSMEITESLNPMEAQRRRDPVRRIAESDPSRMTNTMFASKYPVGAVLYFRTDQKEVTDSQIKEHFRKLGAKDSMVVHHSHGHIYGLAGFPTAAEMKTKLGQAACSALGIWARPFSSAARGNYQRAFESRQ
ncbi:hypothetical protein FOZ61_004545 [Perkinsus olseni]|uniref:Uncharacterized protein n=1 Tax=Perkinsus olseni TaxID=32597 RepID=A0A7J6LK71_PEROL|nr:hypothetical protein FOZ61_004545 [Perkinsus olseni]